jgi:hypothetical protein
MVTRKIALIAVSRAICLDVKNVESLTFARGIGRPMRHARKPRLTDSKSTPVIACDCRWLASKPLGTTIVLYHQHANTTSPFDATMIAATRRWFRRNRTSLAIGAGVIGAGYVAGQYVLGKISEARQRMSEDRIAKEKCGTIGITRISSDQALITVQFATPIRTKPGGLHIHRPGFTTYDTG